MKVKLNMVAIQRENNLPYFEAYQLAGLMAAYIGGDVVVSKEGDGREWEVLTECDNEELHRIEFAVRSAEEMNWRNRVASGKVKKRPWDVL